MLVTYQIRTARPSEWEAVGELTASGYASDGHGSSDYVTQLRDAASRAAEAELLVAADSNGAILGTVTWCPVGSAWRELATRPEQGEFRMLTTSPAARRRGVARALVDDCMERACAAGISEVVICSAAAMTKAHALYRSIGFERVPALDWRPADDIQLLAFRLGLAARTSAAGGV